MTFELAKPAKNHTSICVVWPAYFKGGVEPTAHVTALFLGKTGGRFAKAHQDFRENLENFVSTFEDEPGTFNWDFGHVGFRNNIPAMLLSDWRDTVLHEQYLEMRDELGAAGVPIDTSFDFRPHVTVSKEPDPQLTNITSHIHLERPIVWWGNSRGVHSKHQELANVG